MTSRRKAPGNPLRGFLLPGAHNRPGVTAVPARLLACWGLREALRVCHTQGMTTNQNTDRMVECPACAGTGRDAEDYYCRVCRGDGFAYLSRVAAIAAEHAAPKHACGAHGCQRLKAWAVSR